MLQPSTIVDDAQLDEDLRRLRSMATAAGDLARGFQEKVDALREACIKRDQVCFVHSVLRVMCASCA